LNKNPFHVNATFVALPVAVRCGLAKLQQSAALGFVLVSLDLYLDLAAAAAAVVSY